jgi:XTP/dITP diphosphohydrolase
MRVVLASGNPGKLRELSALLGPLGFELTTQSALGIEPPPETGSTFLENALLKARYAARLSSLPALADDSGIEIDALGGRPGVYSARYAGKQASDAENNEKLLQELQGIPQQRRTARYQCVIVFVRHAEDASPLVASGTWDGTILGAPRGSGGFGYDPLFMPRGLERTAAELEPELKNQLSHRGQALAMLMQRLRNEPAVR